MYLLDTTTISDLIVENPMVVQQVEEHRLRAALAHRLDAVMVSSDADFDALPIKRENWREPQS